MNFSRSTVAQHRAVSSRCLYADKLRELQQRRSVKELVDLMGMLCRSHRKPCRRLLNELIPMQTVGHIQRMKLSQFGGGDSLKFNARSNKAKEDSIESNESGE
jgi:hypothetical protein